MTQNDGRKEEKLGRALFTVTYWLYALSVIIPVTVISGFILHFAGMPLWPAPLAGLAVWLVIRTVRRLILRIFIRLSRM